MLILASKNVSPVAFLSKLIDFKLFKPTKFEYQWASFVKNEEL